MWIWSVRIGRKARAQSFRVRLNGGYFGVLCGGLGCARDGASIRTVGMTKRFLCPPLVTTMVPPTGLLLGAAIPLAQLLAMLCVGCP